jgi:hypothetical protein
VGVVDDHGHEHGLGIAGDQAEGRRADGEPVTRVPRRQREGATQRVSLRLGDPVDQVQSRTQQLGESGKRQLALTLAAGRLQYASGRPETGHSVLQQGGLADSGLADNGQHGGLPQTSPRGQPADPVDLWTPPHEHLPHSPTPPGAAQRERPGGAPEAPSGHPLLASKSNAPATEHPARQSGTSRRFP